MLTNVDGTFETKIRMSKDELQTSGALWKTVIARENEISYPELCEECHCKKYFHEIKQLAYCVEESSPRKSASSGQCAIVASQLGCASSLPLAECVMLPLRC